MEEEDRAAPVGEINNVVEAIKVPVAHDLAKKVRSADVIVEGKDSGVGFKDFNLSEEVVNGLHNCGFVKPSPIQLQAIPLGRLGFDLLLQAKSGTGKTCVFSVICLESVTLITEQIQVLVLCPSREIAYQSKHVIKAIGTFKSGLKVRTFIGGKPVQNDLRKLEDCHIALGTPGRIAHLLREHEMDLSAVRVFVLDEADKLLDDSFYKELKYIYDAMPKTRQVLAVSATYPHGLEHFILRFMNAPIKVQLDAAAPVLLALDQFAIDVKKVFEFTPVEGQSLKMDDIFKLKFKCLRELLRRVPFSQAIIFSDYQLKAEKVYDELRAVGIDVVLMSGALSQKLRLDSLNQLQHGKCRIMVATDLVARGIDCESVDFVINFECPQDISTYIHRMGRAGRFGAFGTVATLLGFGSEWSAILRFQSQVQLNVSLVTTLVGLNSIGHQAKPAAGLPKLGGTRRTQPTTEEDGAAELYAAAQLALTSNGNCSLLDTEGWECKVEASDILEIKSAAADLETAYKKLHCPTDTEGKEKDEAETNGAGDGSDYAFTSEIVHCGGEESEDPNLVPADPVHGRIGKTGRVLSQGIRGGRGGVSRILHADLKKAEPSTLTSYNWEEGDSSSEYDCEEDESNE